MAALSWILIEACYPLAMSAESVMIRERKVSMDCFKLRFSWPDFMRTLGDFLCVCWNTGSYLPGPIEASGTRLKGMEGVVEVVARFWYRAEEIRPTAV